MNQSKKPYMPNNNSLGREIIKLCLEFIEIPRVAFSFFDISKNARSNAMQKLIDNGYIGEISENRANKGLYLTKKGKSMFSDVIEEEPEELFQEKYKKKKKRIMRFRAVGYVGTFLDSIGIRVCTEDKVPFNSLQECTDAMVELYLKDPERYNFCKREKDALGNPVYVVKRTAIEKENQKKRLGMVLKSPDEEKGSSIYYKSGSKYTGTYYHSREIKDTSNNQNKYSKTIGLLLTSDTEYLVYHFDESLMWYEMVEEGISRAIRKKLVNYRLKSIYSEPIDKAIFCVPNMNKFIKRLKITQKVSNELNLGKTFFNSIICVPMNENGQFLLSALMVPNLLNDIKSKYTPTDSTLSTYNLVACDIKMINIINLKEQDVNVICLDWQKPYIEQMISKAIAVNYITITNRDIKTLMERGNAYH